MSTVIPTSRPVIGEDLDTVRDQLGLSTSEACNVFGMSMTKWSKVVRKSGKEPVSKATLALLVRTLNKRPDLSLLPRHPAPEDVLARMRSINEKIDLKRLSVYFGCEASSGYRWITRGSDISPALARLLLVFARLFDRARENGLEAAEAMMEEWREMVEHEAQERGVSDVFNTGRWVMAPGATIGRPVRGEDLDALRDALGLSTSDACWLYGLSMPAWTKIAKRDDPKEELHGARKPLANVTLALLVRVLQKYPEMCPVMPAPSAEEVFNTIAQSQPEIDRKRMAIMFGCEASSGYRWLTTNSDLGPVLVRLYKMFMRYHEETKDSLRKGEKLIKDWEKMVEAEAEARGVTNVFSRGRWKPKPGDEVKRSSTRRRAKPGTAKQQRAVRAATKAAVVPPPVPVMPVPDESTSLTPEQALATSLGVGKKKKTPRAARATTS